MSDLNIVIRNTHFVVTVTNRSKLGIVYTINGLLKTYAFIYDYKLKRKRKALDREYFSKSGKNEYRYPITLYGSFLAIANRHGVTDKNIILRKDTEYKPAKIDFKLNPKFKDYDYQKLYINEILTSTTSSQLLKLKTGKGKTYISMRVANAMKQRFGIIILPKYRDKWIADIKELTDISDDDVCVISGRDSIENLVNMEHIHYKVFILSLTTISNYVRDYQLNPDMYSCSPDDFIKITGIGLLLHDEAHKAFHSMYINMLYLNPKRLLSITATYNSKDPGKERMYKILYPANRRITNLATFEPYATAIGIKYRCRNPEYVKSEGVMGYSHVLVEQSIMRTKGMLKRYFDMLYHYVKVGYIQRRKPGQKMMVYFALTDMCGMFVQYLKEKEPDLNILRYIGEDDYENVLTPDISVTTNGSSGEAIDVSGLITVLQTVVIGSMEANLQALGRLRSIEGSEVIYYFLYTEDIPKHVSLTTDRVTTIKDEVKKLTTIEYVSAI